MVMMITIMKTMMTMMITIMTIIVIAQTNNRVVWIALIREGVRRLRI